MTMIKKYRNSRVFVKDGVYLGTGYLSSAEPDEIRVVQRTKKSAWVRYLSEEQRGNLETRQIAIQNSVVGEVFKFDTLNIQAQNWVGYNT